MKDLKEKYRKELQVQKDIDGSTPDLGLLFRILDLVQMQSEWAALTTVVHRRYGRLSYEVHHFHYPSPLLRKLEYLFTKDYGRREDR